MVVEIGEASIELQAEAATDQTRRRRVDGELCEPVEQVDLTFVTPLGDHLLDLTGDGLRVSSHELVAKRLVVEHLPAALWRCIEDHALAEHRLHERVGLCLVEDLLWCTEEELVRPRATEHRDVSTGQIEAADVAAL